MNTSSMVVMEIPKLATPRDTFFARRERREEREKTHTSNKTSLKLNLIT